MLFAKYILKDRIIKLNNIFKNLKDTQETIDIEKGRFYTNLYDVRLALEECVFAFNSNHIYNIMLNNTKRVNKLIADASTGAELKALIKEVTDLFLDFDYTEDFRYSINSSYKSLSNIRTYDLNALESLKALSKKVSRPVSFFEPNCSEGNSIHYMKEDNENILTYGNTIEGLENAREIGHKIVRGPLKGSRIKNEAFDIILAKCNIAFSLEENMTRTFVEKPEREFMYSVEKYLRPNGAVMFVIPFFRMYKDICDHIAKNYTNVQVFRASNDYWIDRKFIYIYAQKKNETSKTIDSETYETLRACFNQDNIPSILDFNNVNLGFNLPSKHINIDLFKGSLLDMDELHFIVDNSKMMEQFYKKQNVEKLEDSSTRPLLPFNVGQLGLVLTSGCLDGIIDEGDGNFHLVKGRVSKKSETSSQVVDGVLEQSDTLTNKVEINIILPNGEFKTLT